MDDSILDRRQLLGGMAMAAGAAVLPGRPADAAQAGSPWPDFGASQPPTITGFKDKVAYITGGSSGIGLGIARALHEAGAKVILGNRDESQFGEALEQFPEGDARVRTIVHDVLDREGWERKADEIEQLFGPVDILVNNAGVGRLPNVLDGTLKDWDWAMGVNFWGAVCGARTFVPRMLARGSGCHIVTTSSTDGVLFGSGNVYAVTKMAVSGFMEALRHELRNSNIGTSNLLPGATTTNLAQSPSYRPDWLKNDGQPAAPRPAAPAPPPAQPAAPRPDTGLFWARPQDPLTVGRLVVDGILHNDMWIFPAPEYRVGVEARYRAIVDSMVDHVPMPDHIAAGRDNYFRTPIYVQEIAHRRATRQRTVRGL